jgi:hypothetical protein
MNNTRWGKNWGTFERIDWCDDIDINTFFEYVSSLSSPLANIILDDFKTLTSSIFFFFCKERPGTTLTRPGSSSGRRPSRRAVSTLEFYS